MTYVLFRRVGIGNRNSGIKQTFWSTVMKSLQRDNVLKALYRRVSGLVGWDTSMHADFEWDDCFGLLSVRWVHCRRPNRNWSSWSNFILEKLDLQTFYRKNTKRSQLHF